MRRAIAVACIFAVAACGSSPPRAVRAEPPWPPAAPPADAVIEGRVVDPKTGIGVEGVTIASGLRGSSGGAAGISDANGHYRIEVPHGVHDMAAYYRVKTFEPGTVEVRPHEVARFDFQIEYEPEPVEVPPCAGPIRKASSAEVEALVAAVLARYLEDRSSIMGGRLVPERGPLHVVAEVDGRAILAPTAIPAGASRVIVLTTHRELEARARRTQMHIRYLALRVEEARTGCAVVHVGSRVATPPLPPLSWFCTCSSDHIYNERDGHWVFRREGMAACGG